MAAFQAQMLDVRAGRKAASRGGQSQVNVGRLASATSETPLKITCPRRSLEAS
jgi:hypothetical protein